ncbi:MAG: hypothetical protein GY808_15655 [Gammaproteobacteria bacterium]|nr:hypothetical protein [Gammaproteobacteria bacterium]
MNHKMFMIILAFGLIASSFGTYFAKEPRLVKGSAVGQTVTVDGDTGVITWSTTSSGVYFALKQLLPIQVMAFYLKRGFSDSQIEPYTQSCVFMAVLRNDSAPGPIHFISNNWPVDVKGQLHRPLSVNQWVDLLSTTEVKKSALIAFRWAQFPIEQQYEPGGDWNQGMISVGLKAGSQFTLLAKWDVKGKPYHAKLQGVICAK